MSTKHRYADVITAWANGEAIQCQPETMSGWPREWSDGCPIDEYGTPTWNHPHYRWRIKPRMCSLNGHEFPAPETKAPDMETPCYVVDSTAGNKDCVVMITWLDSRRDNLWLRRARIHLSKDAAIAHARAEILAVGGTLEDES